MVGNRYIFFIHKNNLPITKMEYTTVNNGWSSKKKIIIIIYSVFNIYECLLN